MLSTSLRFIPPHPWHHVVCLPTTPLTLQALLFYYVQSQLTSFLRLGLTNWVRSLISGTR